MLNTNSININLTREGIFTMKDGTKLGFSIAGVVIALLLIVFAVGMLSLGWHKFFDPKVENVKREVFEQTQSRVHGTIQELARYYDQYNNASTGGDREAIRQFIIMRFSAFDEKMIDSEGLRNFLVSMRGF